MAMYNFVSTGFDAPEISLTSASQYVYRFGGHYKPKAGELPFDTTGEWDVDKLKFESITDFAGVDAPVVYMSAKIISDTAAAEMPAGLVDVKQDMTPTDDDVEIRWTGREISRARDVIECHVNGCPSATETVALWRAYWVALRMHVKNPVGAIGARPTAPDA